jgi:hypothetical protein
MKPAAACSRQIVMRRITAMLTLVLVVAAGCAAPGSSGSDNGSGAGSSASAPDVFTARAEAVAEAWRQSTAASAWRSGFVPLEELTVAPASGFRTDALKQAFLAGWYVTRVRLERVKPPAGTVTFAEGPALAVELIGASEAYAAIDKGDAPCPGDNPVPDNPGTGPGTGTDPGTTGGNSGGGPGGGGPGGGGLGGGGLGASGDPDTPIATMHPGPCAALNVIGVTLGQTKLRTSRGEATVPAWLFTVAGLNEPIARVAVAPAKVAPLPSPSVPPNSYQPGLVTAQDLVSVDGAKITYRLGVGACDTDIRPLVHETDTVVVVGGRVTPPTSGVCTNQLKLEPVTVTLDAPLGSRPVVDWANGNALPVTPR